MTRTEAKNFQSELNTAIESILRKYHLSKTRGNVTFGDRDVKVTLSFEQLEANGAHKADPYTENMLRYEFHMNGVMNTPSTIVGSKVKHLMGDTFVITGYNSKAKKFPIIATGIKDGKSYKLSGRGLQFIN